MEVYLDNSATTKPCRQAVESACLAMNECFGNPSSLHQKGFEAMQMLENSRAVIAKSLGVENQRVFFTPSGTVANNTAIAGATESLKRKGNKIVTTAFEHPSVHRFTEKLADNGFEVVTVMPDQTGNISIASIENAIDENTILVSVMAVNNEVGSIIPFEKIKRIIKKKNSPALLHVDAVQAYMKMKIRPAPCGIDLMSISAHKIHGIKGAGALYIDKSVRIKPYILGGGQENNICSGTQAMPCIAAFAAAVESFGDTEKRFSEMQTLNRYLREKLKMIDGVYINSPDDALPYIINISIDKIPSQVTVNYLSENGIYISAGSACSKGHRSDVLVSMGLPPERIDSAVRISFSYENTKDDADRLVDAIREEITRFSKK